jgi:hypothetical protein
MAFPFKPGDWVSDAVDRIAQVKSVYESQGEVLFDLVMFDRDGNRLGRVSPAMGGPRRFEPACSIEGWERIGRPHFPVELKFIRTKTGSRVARYWAGDRLPPANWTPTKRRLSSIRIARDDKFKKALQQIAAGHNDAQRLARDVLAGRL